MDKSYADTVRLLLTVAPEVFANDIFAMKGGTAINLFVQDMPRLSVDIDVVYRPWQVPREQALAAINGELAAISQRVAPLGIQTRLVRSKDLGDTKLIVENDTSQVKIEVNVVFRGTVLPVERRTLSAKTWSASTSRRRSSRATSCMPASGWQPWTDSTRATCSTCGSSTNRAASATAWSSASCSTSPDTTGRRTKCCSATTRTSPRNTSALSSA